jgi:hypothetical protein
MTDQKDDRTPPEAEEGAHTEVRRHPPGEGKADAPIPPKPRTKPENLPGDDDDDDDLFNDMPV